MMKLLAALAAFLLVASLAAGGGYKSPPYRGGYSGSPWGYNKFIGSLNPPPTAPSSLEVFAGDGFNDLFWEGNEESDFHHFNIYRGVVSGTRALFDEMAEDEQSGYTDNTAANDSTYFYSVTSVDDAAKESVHSNEASGTPSAPEFVFNSFVVTGTSEAE